jgi:hypothetical protein
MRFQPSGMRAWPDVVASIDWAQPWLSPWRSLGETVAARVLAGQPCHEALNVFSQHLPEMGQRRFVPQAALPSGAAYEEYIFRHAAIPTRDGVHDFFNGLAWMLFPRTKSRLNALQAQQIAQAGIQSVRGPARDALTLLDENAVFLQAPDALWEALRAKDWHSLFITLRPAWRQTRVLVFGHALQEKLVVPRKGITGHVYRVQTDDFALPAVDAWVAAHVLSLQVLETKPFANLPMLGVPGWYPPNEDPLFYDDLSVFRKPQKLQVCNSPQVE